MNDPNLKNLDKNSNFQLVLQLHPITHSSEISLNYSNGQHKFFEILNILIDN